MLPSLMWEGVNAARRHCVHVVAVIAAGGTDDDNDDDPLPFPFFPFLAWLTLLLSRLLY